ncbi:MAG TPA: response regulator transcription factor [Terriglobia bacterium]|nr:response regulator transcription factor [Terriglobia bacterium]
MSPIQVLIVDDHAIFRQGLRKLFDEHTEFAVMGEAASGTEAINAVKESSPDIMLLDLQLGDMTGLDVLRRLGTGIKTRTILLGADIQRADELTAVLLGACGIVGKYSASETLFRSIRVVMGGEIWVKREVIAELIGMLRTRESSGDAMGHFGLTTREMEIVKAVVQGMGNREISESLGISQFTVKHYMTRIFDKLLVANRVELALFATRQGLAQNRPR